MAVLHGRLDADACMEKIAEHCLACYEEGFSPETPNKALQALCRRNYGDKITKGFENMDCIMCS